MEEVKGELSPEELIKQHQQAAGRVGGLSRSDKKRRSSSANLLKARINRWKGRETAARLAAGGKVDGIPQAPVHLRDDGEDER